MTILNSATVIQNSVFSGCGKLLTAGPVGGNYNIKFAWKDAINSIGGPDSLKSITIPKSVTSIGRSAFSDCSSLTSVTIPNSVTTIGYSAFSGCSSLTQLTVPDSVTSIDSNLCDGCTNLEKVELPEYITSIGDEAFRSCTKLKEVIIKQYVGNIGSNAFVGCINLKISGYKNSFAEKYAQENGIPFTNFGTCYTVKFVDDNYASFDDMNDRKVIFGKTYGKLPILISIHNGKTFVGWFTQKNGGIRINENTEVTINSNHTLYTHWADSNSTDPIKRFSDVYPDKWYSKPDGPIAYVIANGIMNGTGDGMTFEPEGNCTREMFVQILYNSEGKPGAGPSNPFSDVKKSWYYDAVTWAVANGVTTGTSATTFGVGGKVTREQLAQFLMNYAKKRGFDTTARADVGSFPDNAQISGWANEAISWANANGIINGKVKDGVNFLDPKGNATRAEVAQMIMGFQKRFGK